jgi:hypothetical protein
MARTVPILPGMEYLGGGIARGKFKLSISGLSSILA